MNIGIDKIGIDVSDKYIDIKELAIKRNVDVDKYILGIGQEQMSIVDKTQDVVSLAINSCKDMLDQKDKEKIDLLIFATESSFEQSKALSIYLHKFLKLKDDCKCIEVKQACFGLTAALNIAYNHIYVNKGSKVLIVGSDIAKYGINTAGEVTQGAGAISFLISENPKILRYNNDEINYCLDVMDFWRPIYSDVPFVDGQFSLQIYLEALKNVYDRYKKENLSAICLHVPYSKLVYKGLKYIKTNEKILSEYENQVKYNKRVGNIYTGSLYLSLVSLLKNSNSIKNGDNIGMFSYGSGMQASFFTLTLINKEELEKLDVESLLNSREKISIDDYEKIFFEKISIDEEGNATLNGDILKSIDKHKRIYENERYLERKL